MLLAPVLALVLGMPALTPPELARVLQGDVLAWSEPGVSAAGTAAGYGLGAIEIDASIPAVWKVLANYDDKAEYQPRVVTSKVVDRSGDVLRVAVTVDATLMTVRYTGLYTLDPATHSVHWVLDTQAAGNSLQAMEGGYTLVYLAPAKTILRFRTFVATGSLVPQFIQNHFSLKAIPALLTSIKKRVESGGTYHK